jgi:hypothetical protein
MVHDGIDFSLVFLQYFASTRHSHTARFFRCDEGGTWMVQVAGLVDIKRRRVSAAVYVPRAIIPLWLFGFPETLAPYPGLADRLFFTP